MRRRAVGFETDRCRSLAEIDKRGYFPAETGVGVDRRVESGHQVLDRGVHFRREADCLRRVCIDGDAELVRRFKSGQVESTLTHSEALIAVVETDVAECGLVAVGYGFHGHGIAGAGGEKLDLIVRGGYRLHRSGQLEIVVDPLVDCIGDFTDRFIEPIAVRIRADSDSIVTACVHSAHRNAHLAGELSAGDVRGEAEAAGRNSDRAACN